ncbi:ComF family protein [Derxia gummosa]|uniref:ComF family protein n=1 Tax=Derxia gummosa DSM 723 TaxID=1121388 RepID=A0A8B6XA92_9BURK|nr:ComF family protein [Derxia gummosa]
MPAADPPALARHASQLKLHSPRMFMRTLAAAAFGNRCVACDDQAGAHGLCVPCLRFARRIERRIPRCAACAEEIRPGMPTARKRPPGDFRANAADAAPDSPTGIPTTAGPTALPHLAGPFSAPPLCRRCAASVPPWDFALVGASYAPPWDAIDRGLKYGGQLAHAAPLALLIACAARARRIDLAGWVLLPIPLAPSRLAARGHNQARQIARMLADATGASVDNGALLRRRDTPAIATLGRAARVRAVADAFALAPGAHARLAGRRVALVDDVLTTGATLAEAARALAPLRLPVLAAIAALRTPPPDSEEGS